ncbi:MAG: hypothetical protein IJ764_02740 [Bacteroidales bacterium]|nr:hypothetical protein [Bacteroidales bacterium]
MKNTERIAVARIVADLIKADSIIDAGEMEHYALLKKKYGLTREHERAASDTTFADAIHILQQSDAHTRKELLSDCSDMTVSDGFCDPTEAIIMLALNHTIGNAKPQAKVVSIHEQEVRIESNQVLYIENAYESTLNEEIAHEYRNIVNEWRSAGMSFVYVPHIASHYRQFSEGTFRDVAQFLAPNISNDEVAPLVAHLSHLTTAQFCKEQIVERLNMQTVAKTRPSLMMKVGSGYVGQRLYGDFLFVEVGESVATTTRQLRDEYVAMLSSSKVVVSNVEEQHGQFLYRAFYKQIFDMYTLRTGVASSVAINPYKGEVALPEIGRTLEGIKRKEKALYVLLLYMSETQGGICFTPPTDAKKYKEYASRSAQVMCAYNKIYELFGGEKDAAPDIFLPEIRRPMVANIRKSVKQLASLLQNPNDYTIHKDEDGLFYIPIEKSIVNILTANGYAQLHTQNYLPETFPNK